MIPFGTLIVFLKDFFGYFWKKYADDHKSMKNNQTCKCLLGNFSCCFCRLPIFFYFDSFSKEKFRNSIRISNRLDPDQSRRFVWSALSPNWLQSFFLQTTLVGKELKTHQMRARTLDKSKPSHKNLTRRLSTMNNNFSNYLFLWKSKLYPFITAFLFLQGRLLFVYI